MVVNGVPQTAGLHMRASTHSASNLANGNYQALAELAEYLELYDGEQSDVCRSFRQMFRARVLAIQRISGELHRGESAVQRPST